MIIAYRYGANKLFNISKYLHNDKSKYVTIKSRFLKFFVHIFQQRPYHPTKATASQHYKTKPKCSFANTPLKNTRICPFVSEDSFWFSQEFGRCHMMRYRLYSFAKQWERYRLIDSF